MKDVVTKGTDGSPKWSLLGAVAAAVGASACCLAPLVLVALGIGGAWAGSLTGLEEYRPYWMAAALIFLGLAFRQVYGKPAEGACAPRNCRPPTAGRRNKVLVWTVAVLLIGLLALPFLIPYAFGGGPEESAVPRQVTRSAVLSDRGRSTRNVSGRQSPVGDCRAPSLRRENSDDR